MGAQGYPDINIDHFLETLSKIVSQVYNRDRDEVIKGLVATVTTSAVANQIRRIKWTSEPYLPKELRKRVANIDTAVGIAQLAYDPDHGRFIMGLGPLQGYKILHSTWEAGRFKPAHVILQNRQDEDLLWVAVRGTHEVQDLLTDLTTEPMAFMDGHVHKGIFKAAQHIAKQVRKHAYAGRSKIWLTGHSLGGGAAALAAVMLQDDGFNAKAIVFGAPSCVYTARWIGEALYQHVTSIVLDTDVIPRLNNHTLSELLAPQDAAAQVQQHLQAFLSSASTVLFGVVDQELKLCQGGTICPPGRNYVMESAGKRYGWGIREMERADLEHIIAGPRMLSDHGVQAYFTAIQEAHFRHMRTKDEL
eukprot:CAMPEP_0177692168 /NCGR_PEP_ID=MMETSP0484_2-20121128/1706_1 /TAXON_ID=354590 /ORGANISM="Rhodomonas lens, Strain RHODO" /LENGTH=360 /DNA_ID=CAMNT_0019202861 /DNA_START=66 /DNA_END=1148 /DNA_ORIENTATION=+